jgi:hypothetical protein
MANLPYDPTFILSSTAGRSHLVYIFLPDSLIAVNASGILSSTALSNTTVSKSLPFGAEDEGTSYLPLMGTQGTIYVYVGQCEEGNNGAALWAFSPDTEGLSGTWSQEKITNGEPADMIGLEGPNFLAAGMEYSSTVNGSSDFYFFGGMCPNSTDLNIQNWQASANYSNSMITLQSASTSSTSTSEFIQTAVLSQGPPIAEAGFTITGLQPTYSNGNTSQQQDFVLLGGHTQEAFINMSQVALFSLPQQTWAFLPINGPSAAPNTDLATRSAASIDPRSGHTAILSSSGMKVVVFGGWVGNVLTPADPQLAVLELGEGYGGTGDWQWATPDQSGTGIPDGAGLYGHGAAMLPGDVMMITGGFSIPASSAATEPSTNSATYFFNMTSNTWLSTYTNPAAIDNHHTTQANGSGGLAAAAKAGIGAGVGIGLALLIATLLFGLCFVRRKRRRKEAREKELRELALGAQRFHSAALGSGGIDGRGGGQSAVEWIGRGGEDAYPWAPQLVDEPGRRTVRSAEAERTGLHVEIPSPTRGLRRSLHSRASQQTPWYDDGRRSRASGNIHPIDERDEYEEDRSGQEPVAGQEMKQITDVDLLATAPTLDPFVDPPAPHLLDASRTPSPESPAQERQREVQSWMNDWTAAENRMQHQAGRSSPEKGERTSSTLSEKSAHSLVSALSIQRSVGTISRSISQRSAVLFNARPLSSSNSPPGTATTLEARDFPHGQASDYRRSQSLTLNLGHRRTDTAESFETAPSSFTQLQAEGETLLGGYHGTGTNLSPNRSQSNKGKSWVGTMRRAFTGHDRSPNRSPDRGDVSSCSSPTKHHHGESTIPRRAASAGAMLWRMRQGARDWNVEEDGNYNNGPGATAQKSPEGGEEEEEWDVESAVERRVVQVMFTVPKEKLRVVNAGPEGDGESIVSIERDVSGDRVDET